MLQGVEPGPSNVMLEVRPCQGLARAADGSLEKRFSKKAEPYPLQARHTLSFAGSVE